MKKIILANMTVTFTLYIIVYLIYTFVIWNFTNPFWWLINLPNFTNEKRASILFGWVIYYIIINSIIVPFLSNETNETK